MRCQSHCIRVAAEGNIAKKHLARIFFTLAFQNTKKIMGRHSTYSQETAKEICKMLESGLTLTQICQLPDMPHISTIYDWQDANPEFSEMYSRARSRQADTLASKVLDEAMSSHDAQIGRLRMDALKWTASKLAPKRYGDKVEVEQTGQSNFKISFNVPDRVGLPGSPAQIEDRSKIIDIEMDTQG